MTIHYRTDRTLTADELRDVLVRSSLGERRPIDDPDCMKGMVTNGPLLFATAWDGERCVGFARSLTDYVFACYLSDLAVDASCQKMGIGRRLIDETQKLLGPHCKIVLLAAPAAAEYYPRIGFDAHPRCWVLTREKRV